MRRYISILMALVMLLSILPMQVMSEELEILFFDEPDENDISILNIVPEEDDQTQIIIQPVLESESDQETLEIIPDADDESTVEVTLTPSDEEIPGEGETTPTGELAVEPENVQRYATANQKAIAYQASVSGGTAPYTVNIQVKLNGEVVYGEVKNLEAEGEFAFEYMPVEFGVHTVAVTVADSAEAQAEAVSDIPVAVNEYETAETWDKSVKGVSLTNDWAKDLVKIAKTQIGYEESQRNFIIDKNGIRHSYSRYGDWYGAAYSDWCAMFVAFCLHYANIPGDAIPYSASCTEWMAKLESAGAFRTAASGYIPEQGDLVFFDIEGKAHVGIVIKVDDSDMISVEGNVNGAVVRKEYALSDSSIVGYGSMAVLAGAETNIISIVDDEPEADDSAILTIEDEEDGGILMIDPDTEAADAEAMNDGPATWSDAPVINLIYQNGDGDVVLGWTVGADADQYAVYERVNGNDQWLMMVTAKTVTLKDVDAGTRSYTVQPVKNVDGSNKYGNMANPASVNVNAVPAWHKAPVISTIYQNASSGDLIIQWTVQEAADSYIIYEVSGDNYQYVVSTTDQSISIPDLDAGTRKYAVQAVKKVNGVDKYGTMSGASTVQISQIEAWKKKPVITAIYQRQSDGGVYIEWSVQADADSYIIYETVNGNKAWVTNVDQKSLILYDIEPGTHVYSVQAKKSVNGSDAFSTMSGENSVTVVATPDWSKPPVITGIYQNGDGAVVIGWSVKGEADTYAVYEVVDGNPVYIKETDKTEIKLNDVEAGERKYEVQPIKTVDGVKKNGTMSNPAAVTVTAIPAWRKAPVVEQINETTVGDVYMRWSVAEDADSYGIFDVTTDAQGQETFTYLTTITEKEITLTGVVPGEHDYRVQANKQVDGSLKSGTMSNPNKITVEEVPAWVFAPVLTAASQGTTVTLTWTAQEQAEKYWIYEEIEGAVQYLGEIANSMEYTIENVTEGEHAYRVQPVGTVNGQVKSGVQSELATVEVGASTQVTVNNVVYQIAADNTAVVVGYEGTDSELTVLDEVNDCPVKAIGESAFEDNAYLVTIHLPDSIEVIGKFAFKNCSNLKNMD